MSHSAEQPLSAHWLEWCWCSSVLFSDWLPHHMCGNSGEIKVHQDIINTNKELHHLPFSHCLSLRSRFNTLCRGPTDPPIHLCY